MFHTIRNISVCKGFILASSVTYLMAGIVLISISSPSQPCFEPYMEVLPGSLFTMSSFLIVIGVFDIVTGGLGCWLAIKENFRVILSVAFKLYLVMLGALLLTGVIVGFTFANSAETTMWYNMKDSMFSYNVEHYDNTRMWDQLQSEFQCCGVNGPEDWLEVVKGLPMSCCEIRHGEIGNSICTLSYSNNWLYRQGCLPQLSASAIYYTNRLSTIGVTIFVMQVLIIVALFFMKGSELSKEFKMQHLQRNLGLFEADKHFFDPRVSHPAKNEEAVYI